MGECALEVLFAIAVLLFVVWGARSAINRNRRQHLLAKYGDLAVVERIMARKVWQGMSVEQLIDSWGRPVDVGRKVYKTKSVETYKYNQTGRNRFASRVTVEGGQVVGWEQK